MFSPAAFVRSMGYSDLTHLAEAGVNLPLLMAKSHTKTSGRCSGTPDRVPKPSLP